MKGDDPTQANARGGRLDRGEAEGVNEVDAHGVRAGEAVGSCAVEVGSWLRESGKEVSIAVVRAFSVLQIVGVHGEEVQPVLYASIVLADLGDVLDRLVVGVDEERRGPEVSAGAFDGPDDATGLEVGGSPGPFVVECGLADKHDGADGTVGLFLLKGGAGAVQAGVTVQSEGAGVVVDGVLVRVDQDRKTGEFSEELSDDGFRFRSENEFNGLLEQVVSGVEPGGKVLQEFAVVPKASEERTELLDGRGHRHKGEIGDLIGVRVDAVRGNVVSKEVGVEGAKSGFRGEKLEVVLSKAFEEGPDVVDMDSWFWVEDYDVPDVGGYSIEALDGLINDLNEAAPRGAATLSHDEPLEESGGSAESG